MKTNLFLAFDTQVCNQIVEVTGANAQYVDLVPEPIEPVTYHGHDGSVEYEILHLQLTRGENNHTVMLKVTFRRQMEFHVFNTILQVG